MPYPSHPRTVRPAGVRPALLATLVAVLLATSGSPSAARAAPCWRPPVDAPVVDPFRAPDCPYCAGNRGVEYRPDAGTPVRAVAAGRVTFSGRVAGVGYVVVELVDGWKVTYGGIAATRLGRGDVVVAGSVVGRSTQRLHLGVRIDGDYVDPGRFLGNVVGRARLVPVDGTSRRPPPAPRLACRP